MKPIHRLWPLLLITLTALACRAAERALTVPTEAVQTASVVPAATSMPNQPDEATPEAETALTVPAPPTGAGATAAGPDLAITPLATQTGSAVPLPTGKPPQSQRAEIRPAELRAELTLVSRLIGYRVLDREGAAVGTIADFIINTCETYIIYFSLAPSGELPAPATSRMFIPFEAVTINSGVLDAQSKSLQLALPAAQFADAPLYPEFQALVPTEWEADVRAFWSQVIRISNLTTGCRVSAPSGGPTEIHKVAYSSDLIGAELRDGNQNRLGLVEEMVLEPESGKLSFFVTRLEPNQGLALVPLRVVNIPKEALGAGNTISLVLLTENERLFSAPQIQSLEQAVQMGTQGAAWAHWGR